MKHERRLAAGIFLLALVPRLLFALAPHPPPFSDMEDYDRTAVNFLMGNGLAMSPEYRAYRPPGYPVFLALLYAIVGHNLVVVRVIQASLSAGSCVLLYELARYLLADEDQRWIRIGVPVLAGLALALYEPNIFLSGVILTETLFIFLLLLFLVILCGPLSERRLSRFAAPVLLGVLSLVRPVGVTYIPALLAASTVWPWRLRREVCRIALSLVLFLLPLIPWTIRNARVVHAIVPLSTNAGVNFYIGHHPGYSYWSTGGKETIRAQTDLDEVAENRLFFQLGFKYILDQPGQAVIDTCKKVEYLLRPGIPPWPMGDHGYDLVLSVFPGLRAFLFQWNWFFLALLPMGVILAWVRLPKGRPMLILAACHVTATLCFFARSRFRAPLEPLFLLWISLALAEGLAWAAHRTGKNKPPTRLEGNAG
jgi:4-amino-4-deoxy-L-arabinose transferase-like glycosyltransferase